jgi:transcriptional regulator with XRE-family HTH domain
MELLEHKDIYFKRAFFYCAKEREGYGGQTAIAHSMGVSVSYINQIATGKKKPGFKAQQKIADACGYDYESFLNLGRDLIQQEEGSTPTTEHRSIKQTTQEVCKEDAVKMDEAVKIMLQRYDKMIESLEQEKKDLRADLRADLERERQEHKDAMAELREDYRELKAEHKDLKAENKELRQGYKQLLEQYRALKQKKAQSSQSPDKSEGKKAVNQ